MAPIALAGIFLFGGIITIIGIVCLFRKEWLGIPIVAIGIGISYIPAKVLYNGVIKPFLDF